MGGEQGKDESEVKEGKERKGIDGAERKGGRKKEGKAKRTEYRNNIEWMNERMNEDPRKREKREGDKERVFFFFSFARIVHSYITVIYIYIYSIYNQSIYANLSVSAVLYSRSNTWLVCLTLRVLFFFFFFFEIFWPFLLTSIYCIQIKRTALTGEMEAHGRTTFITESIPYFTY